MPDAKQPHLPLAVMLYLATAFQAPSIASDPQRGNAATTTPFPLQLEMRVAFDPTAFPSAGRTYLAYELYLTNFAGSAITLRRVEVLDADPGAEKPVATFEGREIDDLLQPVGAQAPEGSNSPRELGAGASVIVFMWIPFDSGAHVPNRLRHRVLTSDSAVEGTGIGTRNTDLRVLGAPVEGANWLASDGPSNDPDNHHRRGILVLDGRPVISRRFAVDWGQIEQGATFAGDARDKHSYYSYGKAVLAVAAGTVVTAKDGLPDNVPGHGEAFHPAVPITLDTVAGNCITLDLGGGQFAYYLHLQPGSLRVKVGDHVKRGQLLARIGGSGDAREPHLHFEVTTSSRLGAGEGVPYLIDRYRFKSADGSWQTRTRELPLGGTVIDFGQAGGNLR
jgi:murein DD-endopeptidase MepM/ murein hydrolase activator NlpD